MKNEWMNDAEGHIPHKNGSVRFYIVGREECVYGYLGWFDMTNWDKGWKKVWKAAEECRPNEEWDVLRHDQLEDLLNNVQAALFEALEDKDERTWLWYARQEKLTGVNK
jgi:hypothetical protein